MHQCSCRVSSQPLLLAPRIPELCSPFRRSTLLPTPGSPYMLPFLYVASTRRLLSILCSFSPRPILYPPSPSILFPRILFLPILSVTVTNSTCSPCHQLHRHLRRRRHATRTARRRRHHGRPRRRGVSSHQRLDRRWDVFGETVFVDVKQINCITVLPGLDTELSC